MGHLKTTTLPVVIVALGMVAKTAPNYVSQIPGALPLTELQKITLTGTAHVQEKDSFSFFMLTVAKREKIFISNKNLVDSNYH